MENNKEELNYKEAYYYLFNQVTNVIAWLKFIQNNAEKFCIEEMPPKIPDIDISQFLEIVTENLDNSEKDED